MQYICNSEKMLRTSNRSVTLGPAHFVIRHNIEAGLLPNVAGPHGSDPLRSKALYSCFKIQAR